jgi:hypothetical protein
VLARAQALLPQDWAGSAGKRFRAVFAKISRYVRDSERVQEVPDLAWKTVEGLATEKHAKALSDYASAESKTIEAELQKRTLLSKTRQEEATAEKLEAEAGTARITEITARLSLIETFRTKRVVPIWDSKGRMTFVKVGPDFDWDRMFQALLAAPDLNRILLLVEQSSTTSEMDASTQDEE